MSLRYAKQNDLARIAEIYTQAFPGSVSFYYGPGSDARVQKLLIPSFTTLMKSGARVLLYGDPAVGYCCYTDNDSQTNRKLFSLSSLKNYLQALIKGNLVIKPSEISKLIHSQLQMKRHYDVDLPPTRGRIMSIALLPSEQSHGIGKVLLDQALLEIGNQHVVLEVRPENEKAYRLYKSAGFSLRGSTRDLLGCWLIMIKDPIKNSSE